MADKSTSFATVLRLSLISCLVSTAWARDNCVLQERTVTRSQVQIVERTSIRRDIVPAVNGERKCVVDFRVRIGTNWHTAYGEYTWPGDRSAAEACAVAVSKAETEVQERVGRSQSTSERILVCKDRPDLSLIANTEPGTVGNAGQFRPHPTYPNRFWHNGAQCRWFVEPKFNGRDIHNYQGIVCEVQSDRWVVVDKF